MYDKERELIQMAKKVNQKEALELMLKNPELMDPLVYLLFAIDAGVSEILPHDKYCLLMKKKAIQSNNKKLLQMAEKHGKGF